MKKIMLVCLCIIMVLTASCSNGNSNADSQQGPSGEKSIYDDSDEELIVSKYENIYTDITEPERLKEGISWPEGQALPTFAEIQGKVDAVSVSGKINDVKSMAAILQGVLNKKVPRLLVLNDGWKNETWPEDMGLEYEMAEDIYEIILKYKEEIKGLIVWDKKQRDTLNLANTLAGLEDCLVVTEKLAETLKAEPYNFEVKYDFNGKFSDKEEVYEYMYTDIWPRCTKRLIVGLNPAMNGHQAHLRDLASASNAAVLWLSPENSSESKILDRFFDECTSVNTYYAGWWTNEGNGIDYASKYGIATVPADFFENYTVYAGMSRELDIPEVPAKPVLENKFYIAFALSDGDNIQYCEHAMKTGTNLWAARKRGEIPVAFTCSPVLLDAAPQILNYYYKTSTENDMLIGGPSGVGYTDIQQWSARNAGEEALKKFAQLTDTYLRRTAFNFITIWDFARDSQAEIYAANMPSLVGFSVQERFSGQKARYLANGTTPFFTTHPRYDGDVPRVEDIIEEQIDRWSGDEPEFMLPQLIAWEAGVPAAIKIAGNLEKKYGDKVEFVRVDHLMMLYSEHMKAPYNISLRAETTASGSDEAEDETVYKPENAVDGSFTKNQGWQSSSEGDKWITVDFGSDYKISRYNVQNAGTGYYSAEYNTRAFRIEASTDGENWTVIDEVNKNRSNIVDKYVDEFTARYVRLYITNPGEDGIARIQEFELYGNKAE